MKSPLTRHKCHSVLTVDLIKMASQVSVFIVGPVHVCCLAEKYPFTDYHLPCKIWFESASQAVLFPHSPYSVNSLKLCKPPLQSLDCLLLGDISITIQCRVSPNMLIRFSFHLCLWLTDFAILPTSSNLVRLFTALHCATETDSQLYFLHWWLVSYRSQLCLPVLTLLLRHGWNAG